MKKNGIKFLAAAAFIAAAVMLSSCGTADVSRESAVSETEAGEGSAASTESTEEGTTGKVASASDMVESENVVEDWMEPVEFKDLNSGVYDVKVSSSSSMFKPESCTLSVSDNKISVEMQMSGSGYKYLYLGTAEEAAKADESELIESEDNAEGKNVFKFEIDALDKGIECAAFSKKKERWYPRTIVFRSDSLPLQALKNARGNTAEMLGLEDGNYSVEVDLNGGSGRASVASPTTITIENGKMTAKVQFSSDNYDYAIVDGERYEADTGSGKSTFEIPVYALDTEIPITADTTAMSKPHEIDYTLHFHSISLEAVK